MVAVCLMRFIADLHIHSPYSRATSKGSHIPALAAWAQIKGAQVLGTGDFTNPRWLQELEDTLDSAEPGFFRCRKELSAEATGIPSGIVPLATPVRFVLSAEICTLFPRQGRIKKIHNLIYAPDFASVRRLNAALARFGNLSADGRPVLKLDARDLLAIVLEQAPGAFLVPAHIWTPWFSLFGSRSGFDSIEECYGDLTPHIFALETGLSSDPDMNRTVSALDRFSLISSSDCHSPAKLCREATVFDTDFDYFSLKAALRDQPTVGGHRHLEATIEFFPEEGKYHHDGHRQCRFRCDPQQTKSLGGICLVCAKPLTIGVLSRVAALADRKSPVYPREAPLVYSLIPLQEILSELLQVGPQSKTVARVYFQLIRELGPELVILCDTALADLASCGVPRLAEAIERMRHKQVRREAGYDGEFGKIRIWD